MAHSKEFEALVADAKTRVQEIPLEELRAKRRERARSA